MDSLDPIDIELLFKTLVVLPQETPKKVKELKEESLNVYPKISSSVVNPKEPKSTYNHSIPFVLITSPELKALYVQKESSFIKILEALSVPHIINSMITDPSIIKEVSTYSCVWCIGLSPELEDEIRKTNHPNLLISPDIITLSTKEEKIAMYTPLKKFIANNQDHLKQLQ
ncbi:hypothetical protein OAP11_03395 [Bacteroidia bacterium]|nr:hypothetical protein [Bacteroidia bacterium]